MFPPYLVGIPWQTHLLSTHLNISKGNAGQGRWNSLCSSWSCLEKEQSSSALSSNWCVWSLICTLDGLQWKLWNASGLWEPGDGWGHGMVSSCISTSSGKGSYWNASMWVRTLLNKQHTVHLKEETQVVSMEAHPQNGVDFGLHTKPVDATQSWWHGQSVKYLSVYIFGEITFILTQLCVGSLIKTPK